MADERLPCLDGLRAVAALSVAVYHAAVRTIEPLSAAGIVLHRLDLGVFLFYVLSGFLLYRPFVERLDAGKAAPSLGPYALRRAIRIFPPYWVALAVTAFALGFVQLPTWGSVITHATLTHHYFPRYFFGQGLDQAWTLSIEVSFYAALPLYAAAVRTGARWVGFRRSETSGVLAVLILGLAAQIAVQYRVPVPGWVRVLPINAPLFALGMGLAVVSVHGRSPGRLSRAVELIGRHPGCLLGVAAAAFAGEVFLLRDVHSAGWTPFQWVARFVLGGVIAAAMVAIAVLGPQDAGRIRRLLRHPVSAWLGTVSYGIYLWHQTAFTGVFGALLGGTRGAGSFWILLATGVTLSILVAAASWYLLERPLLAWAHAKRRVDSQR